MDAGPWDYPNFDDTINPSSRGIITIAQNKIRRIWNCLFNRFFWQVRQRGGDILITGSQVWAAQRCFPRTEHAIPRNRIFFSCFCVDLGTTTVNKAPLPLLLSHQPLPPNNPDVGPDEMLRLCLYPEQIPHWPWKPCQRYGRSSLLIPLTPALDLLCSGVQEARHFLNPKLDMTMINRKTWWRVWWLLMIIFHALAVRIYHEYVPVQS